MLALVIIVSPSSLADWSANGAFEPDTPFDIYHGRMWTDPDTAPGGSKVYFNAVIGAGSTSPNVGATGSRIIPATVTFSAWLGVWKDCNQDGYIGHAESALVDYSAALLLDLSVCPDGEAWNRGGWVGEFIPLAPRTQSNPNTFPRLKTDMEATIWGDFGRPDVPPDPTVACFNAPLPRGMLDSTGGILLVVDCQLDYNIARIITETDQTTQLGIGFDGEGGYYRPDQDCDNPLNQQLDMYGDSPCNDEDAGLLEGRTGRRMVDVWDCAQKGQEKFIDVRDPTAAPGKRGQLSYIPDPETGEPILYITDNDGTFGVPFLVTGGGVYAEFDNGNPLRPGLNDPDGSLADSLTHVSDGTGPCAGAEGADGLGEPLLNGNVRIDPLSGKRKQDFSFKFTIPGTNCAGVCIGPLATAPGNFGLGKQGAAWTADESYGPPTAFANGVVRRSDLTPAGANWFTFYARVGVTTLSSASLVTGVPAYYGANPCGSEIAGVHNGWDCAPSNWYNVALGGRANAKGERPGARYHLIDTDCYDGNTGIGVFASPAILSNHPTCPSVP